MVAINNSYSNGELNGLPETPAIVEIKNVSRRFGDKLALDDVTFRVPAGTVVGLVGENGAGKTTLIKHILGLLKAQNRIGARVRARSGGRSRRRALAHRLPFGRAGHAGLDARRAN